MADVPPPLKSRIEGDVRNAMKSGDRLALETCRMLLAAIKNEEIAKRRPLTVEETSAILAKAVRTRQEAVALYEKGGRGDLAAKERDEIAIVQRYLPAPLTEEEIVRAVEEVLRDLGVSSKKEMGRVMKELMARYPGRVDGRAANAVVSSRLT